MLAEADPRVMASDEIMLEDQKDNNTEDTKLDHVINEKFSFLVMEKIEMLMTECPILEWLFVCQNPSVGGCESTGSLLGSEFIQTRDIVDAFGGFVNDKTSGENCISTEDQDTESTLQDDKSFEKSARAENQNNHEISSRKATETLPTPIEGIAKNTDDTVIPDKIKSEESNEYKIETKTTKNDTDYDSDDTIDQNFHDFETEEMTSCIKTKQSLDEEKTSMSCAKVDPVNDKNSDENSCSLSLKLDNLNTLRLKADNEVQNCNGTVKKLSKLQRFDSQQLECNITNTTCTVCFKFFKSSKALRGHYNAHRKKETIYAVNDLNNHLSPTFSGKNKELSLRKSLPVEVVKYKDADTGEVKKTTVWDILQSVGSGNKNFKCLVCQKTFKKREYLIDHIISVHSKSKPHSCEFCKKAFKFERSMERHKMVMHKNLITCVSCEFCSRMCFSEEKLKIHKLLKCPKRVKQIFKCDTCGYEANSRTKYENHIQSHLGIKKFTCDLCCKKFSTKSSLTAHCQSVHEFLSSFKCSVCEQHFTTRASVRRHHKAKHEKPKFHCEICNKSFGHLYYFRKHALYHTNETHFICEVCGKGFRQKERLIVHHRIHTGEKPFICSVCNASFRSKYYLVIHKRVHNPGSHVCDACGRIFKQRATLLTHMRQHSTETSKRLYTCDFCNKSCGTVTKYKTHIARFHPQETGEVESRKDMRFHKCSMCFKVFSRGSTLKKHIDVHERNPFDCTICLKLFDSKLKLDTHVKKKHTSKNAIKTSGPVISSRVTESDSKRLASEKKSLQSKIKAKQIKRNKSKKVKNSISKSKMYALTKPGNKRQEDKEDTNVSEVDMEIKDSCNTINLLDRIVPDSSAQHINTVPSQTVMESDDLGGVNTYPVLLNMLSNNSSGQHAFYQNF